MGRTSRLHFLVDTGAEVSIVPPSAAQEKIDRNIHDMPLTVLLLLLEKVCFSLMCNYIAHFHGCLLLPTTGTLSEVRIFFTPFQSPCRRQHRRVLYATTQLSILDKGSTI